MSRPRCCSELCGAERCPKSAQPGPKIVEPMKVVAGNAVPRARAPPAGGSWRSSGGWEAGGPAPASQREIAQLQGWMEQPHPQLGCPQRES
ncbi:hypothetical protein NN561_002343 [Cricetulus griseus]